MRRTAPPDARPCKHNSARATTLLLSTEGSPQKVALHQRHQRRPLRHDLSTEAIGATILIVSFSHREGGVARLGVASCGCRGRCAGEQRATCRTPHWSRQRPAPRSAGHIRTPRREDRPREVCTLLRALRLVASDLAWLRRTVSPQGRCPQTHATASGGHAPGTTEHPAPEPTEPLATGAAPTALTVSRRLVAVSMAQEVRDGSADTCVKKASILSMATKKPSRSAGLVTKAFACRS